MNFISFETIQNYTLAIQHLILIVVAGRQLKWQLPNSLEVTILFRRGKRATLF